jgi:integrase
VAGRRGNGEGTVGRYQRRWVARVSLADGRRKHFYGRTRAGVVARMSTAIAALRKGDDLPDDRVVVRDFLSRWIEGMRGTIKPSAWDSFEGHIRVHLIPDLGHIRLSRLRRLDIVAWQGRKLASGRWSPTTVGHFQTTLHRGLADAVRDGLISRNPASLVSVPRRADIEIATLDEEQAGRLLIAAGSDRLAAIWVLALTTGRRRGELLGLRWSDVDLDRREYRVLRTRTRASRRALGGDHESDAVYSSPKRRASKQRGLPLVDVAIVALRAQRARQAEERLVAGPLWEGAEPGLDLVFTSPVGRAVAITTLRRAYEAVLLRAGVPRVRFHDLRHSAASLLFSLGVEPKTISEMLGHSTTAVTLETYTHVRTAVLRDAADRLEAVLTRAQVG